MKKEISIVTPEEKLAMYQKIQDTKNNYLESRKIARFDEFDTFEKLAACQKIETKYIKKRKIGSAMIPYLPHTTAEAILNFIFNFRVSNEVLETKIVEKVRKVATYGENGEITGKKDKVSYDAKALVKFTFTTPDGFQIIRTVMGTHIGYENPATSAFESEKSAISQSWTVVARTFGIGTELEKKEESGYNRANRSAPKSQQEFDPSLPY